MPFVRFPAVWNGGMVTKVYLGGHLGHHEDTAEWQDRESQVPDDHQAALLALDCLCLHVVCVCVC